MARRQRDRSAPSNDLRGLKAGAAFELVKFSVDRERSGKWRLSPWLPDEPFRISSLIRSGDTGRSAIVTPKGLSASSTPAITHAAAGIVPPSPAPFTSIGLRGEGDSIWMIS